MADSNTLSQPNTDAWDDLAAFAIGATDDVESDAVHRLLAQDAGAGSELSAFHAVTEALHRAAPAQSPPPALGDRLRSALGPTSADDRDTSPAALLPPTGQADAKADASKPAVDAGAEPWYRRWFAKSARPAWAIAGAALLLLIGTNLWWMARDAAAPPAQAVAPSDTALMRLLAGDSIETTFAAPDDSAARAHLYWTPEMDAAVLLASSFPQLEPGMAYQVWLIDGETRTSGGLFHVDDEGFGMTVLRGTRPFAEYDAVGITPEPESGSQSPTAPPVVRGPLG